MEVIRNIEIYYFAVVNYTKVQYDDTSRYNNDDQEFENVDYECIVDEFAGKKQVN